jgi:acyl-CoA thioester hydrolase
MHATPLPASPDPAAPHGAFRHPLRVYWEDTDAGGMVFYANYLKFFERARTEWLRTLGFSQQQMLKHDGVMFIVADTALRCRMLENSSMKVSNWMAMRSMSRDSRL